MKFLKLEGINVSMIMLMFCLSLFQYSFLNVPFVLGETKANLVHLTTAEISWLQAHPTIRLAPDPEFRPIEFFDKTGSYAGIGADYVRLITKKLGIKFEVVKCSSWDDVLARMKRREIDVLNAVVKTPEREKFLNFPPPYLSIPSVIIVRKKVTSDLTLDRLNGLRVVMVSGYGYVELIRNTHPKIEIELVADIKAALRKVSFGMADAFVGDLATASFYMESEGITNLKLAGETEPQNISGFAVRSDWPELSHVLEKGVLLITEEERKTIHQKWIHLGSAPGLTMREVKNITLGSMTIMLLIVGGFLLWTRMLNRRVLQRTEDLLKEISERKQVENALRESEKRFLDLSENSTDWIWEFDENEIFTYASPRITKLLGYAPEEIIGQSAYAPMSSPETERIMNEFIRFKEARKPFSHLINVNKHRNGNDVVLESSGVPIIDSEGTFRGYRGIDRDITERKNLEGQLRQAHKMEAIGSLAGGIAHDFNNILAAIIGYADMAKLKTPESSHLRDDIDGVLKASNRAKELVKQILTFSHKGQETRQPMQPHFVIMEALKLMRASLPSTIELQEDIEAGSSFIMANPINIHQVVVNLCTNALHAMENEQGIIAVTVKRVKLTESDVTNKRGVAAGEFIELKVSDTGHGMTKEIVERILEPYFTTKEIGKGSGMGLAVVHGIVKNCEGFMKVDSTPGKGSIFRVYFPVLAKETTVGAQEEQRDPLPMGNERILVVDDEESIAGIYKATLEMQGYRVSEYCSSEKALELFQRSPDDFDLVITDQTMPHLAGSELAKRILQIRADIPIILCTGNSSTISEEKAKEIGIVKFIMKPVSRRDLAIIVREVLDKRELLGI